MNKKNIIKNIKYSIISNLMSFLLSILMIMIMPKLMTIEDYGYWQLFLFYFSFVGFFHFGWGDGIYLRYLGKNSKSIDKKIFCGQFMAILIFQIIIAIFIYVLCIENILKNIEKNIMIYICILLIFWNFNSCCNLFFQAINKIKEYIYLTIVEPAIFLLLIIICFSLGMNNYYNLIVSKIASTIITTIVVMIYLKNILLEFKINSLKEIIEEALKNINVGSKLMGANIINILIIGVIRYGISIGWSINIFGKISLILSISNFLMVFINAISVVMLPFLKNLKEESKQCIYDKANNGLKMILFFLLIVYYPIYYSLIYWIPKYIDILNFLVILFPIFVFESRTALIINSYFKILRKEKIMLKINVIILLFSIITTFVFTKIIHNINYIIVSILFIFIIKSIISEYVLSKYILIKNKNYILLDLVLVGIYILINIYIKEMYAIFIYLLIYSAYILLDRKKIEILNSIKNNIKKCGE